MTTAIDFYTKTYFQAKMKSLASWLSSGIEQQNNPRAYLLGGQSGAGKTRLHALCSRLVESPPIVINGDEYRKLHPHFAEIQDRYGIDAPAHTAKWAGEMTEALIDAFSLQHYNLVIEGTLRTSEVPLATAKLLKERGYEVSLAIMAVKPEISLVSCQIRYELMRIAGTTPRAVDPEHHSKIVRGIADNLSVLEGSGAFKEVLLFNRTEERLFPAEDAAPTASETLKRVLFGEWTPEETEHLAFLKRKLESLTHEG